MYAVASTGSGWTTESELYHANGGKCLKIVPKLSYLNRLNFSNSISSIIFFRL